MRVVFWTVELTPKTNSSRLWSCPATACSNGPPMPFVPFRCIRTPIRFPRTHPGTHTTHVRGKKHRKPMEGRLDWTAPVVSGKRITSIPRIIRTIYTHICHHRRPGPRVVGFKLAGMKEGLGYPVQWGGAGPVVPLADASAVPIAHRPPPSQCHRTLGGGHGEWLANVVCTVRCTP